MFLLLSIYNSFSFLHYDNVYLTLAVCVLILWPTAAQYSILYKNLPRYAAALKVQILYPSCTYRISTIDAKLNLKPTSSICEQVPVCQ
jgi:hypothetical protein